MPTDGASILEYDKQFSTGKIDPQSMLGRLVLFYRWCNAGFAMIRDIREQVVPLCLNRSQRRLLARMMDQAAAGKPIRVVAGKARKQGASTMVQVLFVFLCAHYADQRAITIAHEAEATDEIFSIAQRTASKYAPIIPVEDPARELRYSNESKYTCHTSGGIAVGAGGTPNLLHLSELAKWEKKKIPTEYNAKIAVPDSPTSIIFVESTFVGRELFFKRFEEAADPENSYEQVFNAWYLDDACIAVAPDGFVRTSDEKTLAQLAATDGIELSDGQLQWRRGKIKDLGLAIFRQEYPSTPAEAVQANEGLILGGMRACLIDDLPFLPGEVPWKDRIGGIDFGYHDATVIWSGFYVDQIAYVTDYWSGTETLAAEQVDGLLDGHLYYCDPASLSSRKELLKAAREADIHARLIPAPRKKHAGEDPSATELRQLVRLGEEGRLLVMRQAATQLLVECDSYSWNEKTGKPHDERTEDCGHYDSIQALKYLSMGVVSRGKPKKPREDDKPKPVSRRRGFSRV